MRVGDVRTTFAAVTKEISSDEEATNLGVLHEITLSGIKMSDLSFSQAR